MLGFYEKFKSKLVRTELREGDIIGFIEKKSSQAIRLFRPSKSEKGVDDLRFKIFGDSDTPFRIFPLTIAAQEFETHAEFMAASVDCDAFPIDRGHLPVDWAYQLYKHK